MLTNKVQRIPIESISFAREDRQRQIIELKPEFLESIRRRGVLTPICVTKSGKLIFGERRLTAAKVCGHTEILARIAPDNLTEHDLQLLELEENLMREDLPWQDKARAMSKLFKLSGHTTYQAFADAIGYTIGHVSQTLQVIEETLKGNERVSAAPTLKKAIKVMVREREREQNNAMAEILDTVGLSDAPPREAPPPPEPFLNTSFLDWAPNYSGPKFNLIHCDFPYGIDLDDSDQLQAGGTAHKTYEDSPETFWTLLRCLAQHRNTFLSHSAHMIFWHSMKEDLYLPMRSFLREALPEWTFEDYPLVWMKTDNRGIAPDVERRPRRIYETALFGWRGDRKLVKLGANAYGAPKENGAHPSAKPEPVLRHFLSMVVDHHSRVLDPTCGAGSTIRAAESLGAAACLGLEIDEGFYKDALAKYKKFKSISRLAEMV